MAEKRAQSTVEPHRQRNNHVEWGPMAAWVVTLVALFLPFAFTLAHSYAQLLAMIVLSGFASGAIIGGYRGGLSDRVMEKRLHLHTGALAGIPRELLKHREGTFLLVTSLFAMLYVLGYYSAAAYFMSGDMLQVTSGPPASSGGADAIPAPADDNATQLSPASQASATPVVALWPISPWIAGVTALMGCALGIFTIQYAIYIRAAALLQAALTLTPSKLAQLETSGFKLAKLRDALVEREQLYEPPGNIFVTVGITATFLGLAVGLVTLDLPSFFEHPNETNGDTAERSAAALAALRSFIGCMGLALGMSMLGVLTAIAAQWLRSQGPDEDMEALIARAALFRRKKSTPTTNKQQIAPQLPNAKLDNVPDVKPYMPEMAG